MPPASAPTAPNATAITPTTMSSSTQSMNAIATTAPMKVSAPPIASTSPCVSTARSSVASAPTRDTRSPVRRASNSGIGRRSIRAMSARRVDSTTDSPIRCSR